MVWRSWGDGAPVILLHGGHGSWTHWLANIPALSGTNRLLVPDMPGYGDSDRLPDATLETLGFVIACGLEEILPSPPVTLIGFSFGATVGGVVARRMESRLRRFVLVGASALGLPAPPMEPLENWWAVPGKADEMAAHRRNLARLMIHDAARIDALAVTLQARNARRTRFRSLRYASGDSLTSCLRDVSVPLTAIWGEHDATALGHLLEREALLRRFDPALRFVTIEGAGHWVQYEAPEAFHAALQPDLG
ncbi:alpha/beta fold hydrolase [Salinarimonas soli]|nr:alpha/beta hydrolase [Salinarimonas soli]